VRAFFPPAGDFAADQVELNSVDHRFTESGLQLVDAHPTPIAARTRSA
jgi:hypothetical protein